MRFSFDIPPFLPDSRGNKLEVFEVRDHGEYSDSLLLLCGPDEVAAQVRLSAGDDLKDVKLGPESRKKWTHAFFFSDGVPQEIIALCEHLTQWLSIPCDPNIDIALSLDWYKRPDDSGELVLTEAGRMIQWTKYAAYPNGSSSRQARKDLISALAETIQTHPALSMADVVTSPPGSKGDGTSFGERLGRDVAAEAGKRFVPTSGPAREAQKEEAGHDVREDFEFGKASPGVVLVVDDVFHTGTTLESTALATRRAGASHVLALTAARTIRR